MVILENYKNKSPQFKYYGGAILVFVGAILFSAKAVLIKLTYSYYKIDSASLLTLRMLFALPFYILVAIVLNKRKSNISLNSKNWLHLAILGITGYYIASIFDFEGLQYVSASVERIILFIYPTIVVVWSAIVFNRKITSVQYFALILTYIGLSIALYNDIQSGAQKDLMKGGLFIFISAITYAGYMVYGGELIPKLGSMKFTCYAMMFATLAIVIHFLIVHGFNIFNFPPEVYWFALIMGIFSTVIPTFMISEGINMVGSGNASIIAGIGPISTIVLAYFFLNESFSLIQLLGTCIVLTGVLKVSSKK